MPEPLNPILDKAQQLVGKHRGLTFEVTLTLSGLVVRGYLIDEADYLQATLRPINHIDLTGSIRATSDQLDPLNGATQLEDVLATFGSQMKNKNDSRPPSTAGGIQSSDLIHLENVSLYAPGEIIKLDYWRTSLQSISSIHLSEVKARLKFPAVQLKSS